MPYPVSPTEFRVPAHGVINAADRVRLTTQGFTGERSDTLTLPPALAIVIVSAPGDLVSRSALNDAIQRGGGTL